MSTRHFEVKIKVGVEEPVPYEYITDLRKNVQRRISEIVTDANQEAIVDSWSVEVVQVR